MSNRRTIQLRAGALHEIATEAEEALINADAPFYVRGAQIVRPVVEDVEAARGRRTKIARLSIVTPDALIDWLSRVATWEKFDGRSEKWVVADPPRPVASTILARDGEWRLSPLVGVVTTPTLRPDGSVLSRPGYDPATRLLLLDPPPMPELAKRPARNQAVEALALLDELIGEFPFTDEPSRSVALSAMITPVVRGAMSVAPLHAMRAPSPGSGKSYLVDIASAIATGQRCPVIAAGRTEEENEKRLGAALLAGQPIVSIDNLNGELTGDALCQMVERPSVEVRPLGRSELVRIESRATVFATGNNLVLVGDMVRRVVLCSLDPNLERPELRQFGNDPFGAVLSDRGRYVAAALTIVRAYLAAGCPCPQPALASFEDWSRLVRSSLVWLGRADPVETMEAARAEDPERMALREIVAAWREAIGTMVPVTAGEIIAKAEERRLGATHGDTADYRNTSLREAVATVAGDHQGLNSRRFGRWLSRNKGKIAGDLKIMGTENSHAKMMQWTLAPVR